MVLWASAISCFVGFSSFRSARPHSLRITSDFVTFAVYCLFHILSADACFYLVSKYLYNGVSSSSLFVFPVVRTPPLPLYCRLIHSVSFSFSLSSSLYHFVSSSLSLFLTHPFVYSIEESNKIMQRCVHNSKGQRNKIKWKTPENISRIQNINFNKYSNDRGNVLENVQWFSTRCMHYQLKPFFSPLFLCLWIFRGCFRCNRNQINHFRGENFPESTVRICFVGWKWSALHRRPTPFNTNICTVHTYRALFLNI